MHLSLYSPVLLTLQYTFPCSALCTVETQLINTSLPLRNITLNLRQFIYLFKDIALAIRDHWML